jgi:hypothetical protein
MVSSVPPPALPKISTVMAAHLPEVGAFSVHLASEIGVTFRLGNPVYCFT